MADETKPPPKAAAARPKPAPRPPPEPPTGPTDPAPPDDLAVPAAVAALQAGVRDATLQLSYWVGDWTVIVPPDQLLDVVRFLRDDPATAFDYCSDITASDWPPRAQRFDVIYCLYSTRLRHRLRVKVRAGEGDPVPSVTEIWPAANLAGTRSLRPVRCEFRQPSRPASDSDARRVARAPTAKGLSAGGAGRVADGEPPGLAATAEPAG